MKEVRTQTAGDVAICLSRASYMRAEYVLMELLAPRYHRLDHRDADASADVAEQIYRAGDLAAFFLGYANVGGGVDRHEQQRKSNR